MADKDNTTKTANPVVPQPAAFDPPVAVPPAATEDKRPSVQLPLTKGKPSESDIAMAKAILAVAGESDAPKLMTADEIAEKPHEMMTFRATKACYTPDGKLVEPDKPTAPGMPNGVFSTDSSGYADAVTGEFKLPPYLEIVEIDEDGRVKVIKGDKRT